jgi:dihydrolipoamide dehydrogenase
VIANGSRPAALKGFDVDHENILDSTSALNLTEQPESMLCIGGGYIGLELGTYFAKLGVKVHVAEGGPHLVGMVDPQISGVVRKKLEARGVSVLTETLVKSWKKGKKGLDVTLTQKGKDITLTVDKILLTIGRTPNSDQLQLERAGLRADSKGFLEVDAQRRTKQPHIYAIGDVAGQPMLAHKGSKEGMVAAEAIAGKKVAYDPVTIPAVIFTDPEIATAGLTEAEAKAKGIDVMVGTFPMAANGRALSMNEPDGMVKMIGDKKTGRLLGVHIVGAEASNLIAEAALALEMGAHVEDLALTVHAHPTLPETLMEAAEATLGHAIHIFQRKPSASPAPQARV